VTARRRASACVAAALCLASAACDEKPSRQAIAPLDAPSAADREAAETFASAQALLDAGDARAAQPLLRRVVELMPKHAKALGALGDVLFAERRWDEASPILKRAVAAAPDYRARRKKLFDSLFAQRDYAGAEAA